MKVLSCFAFVIVSMLAASPSAPAQSYQAVVLYPLTLPEGYDWVSFLFPPGITGGGQTFAASFQPISHAFLWNQSSAAIDMHPTNLVGFSSSQGQFTNGTQQVGYGDGLQSTPAFGNHALLWNGTAASAVDLNPTNFPIDESIATGTNGTQQTGYGRLNGGLYHALLWSGTANSAVNLHPSNLGGIFGASFALAIKGSQQVGYGSTGGAFDPDHALLWNGTADSTIDLHPTKLAAVESSYAYGTGNGQQVGYGYGPTITSHALLWNGSADSAVDLNPTNLPGFEQTFAFDTNGSQQVGYGIGLGTDYQVHALLWNGTANSAVDLELLLPPGLVGSHAFSVNDQGVVFGIAGRFSGGLQAVAWIPVPEPQSFLLATLCAAIVCASRQRFSLRRPVRV